MKTHRTISSEDWKDVIGYEGLYQVSNFGRVRGKSSKILAPQPRNGYLRIQLKKGGHIKTMAIHRMVAVAFLTNENGHNEVNHKDEDKTNNRVENLEWCDRSYNCNHGSRTEKIVAKTSYPVLQIDKVGNIVNEFPSTSELRKLGFSPSHISEC